MDKNFEQKLNNLTMIVVYDLLGKARLSLPYLVNVFVIQ
jgi:hypothetical protein